VKRSTRTLLLLVIGALVVGALVDPKSTAAAIARRKLTKGELVRLARDVGFPDADFAASIAMRESGGDPMALNNNPPREVSVGLWQINTLVHHKYSIEDLRDPKRNAEYAYEISKHGTDWSPWSTAAQVVPPEPDFQP